MVCLAGPTDGPDGILSLEPPFKPRSPTVSASLWLRRLSLSTVAQTSRGFLPPLQTTRPLASLWRTGRLFWSWDYGWHPIRGTGWDSVELLVGRWIGRGGFSYSGRGQVAAARAARSV